MERRDSGNRTTGLYITISVRQAKFSAAQCVTLQYNRLNLWHWQHSPYKSHILIIHYMEPLVIYTVVMVKELAIQ